MVGHPSKRLSKYNGDDFQTPPHALDILLPYIKKDWIIWECAEGKGNLTKTLRDKGYNVIGSDILTGKDFLEWQPEYFDCIITNPPYSIKDYFIKRCYEFKKPFALLMPLTALESETRQKYYRQQGLELIIPNKRYNFETPSGKGTGSWFATAWFTNWLNIADKLTFINLDELNNKKLVI